MRTAVCAVALVLASCGGAAPGTVTTAGGVPAAAALASHCTDIPATGLGEGTLCVDSGFRPDVDQFPFANWGRSPRADMNVTVQTLVDLFGHSTVCMPGPETECVLRPRTVQKLDDWNVALGNGRCEGMAALSQRMFLRYETAADYSPGAASAADLGRADTALAQSIVYWWATQFVPEVTRPAAESRSRSPLQLVDDLIRGIANGAGHTVGMYFGGTGHAVTPFAVTRRGGDFVIHVYDNNRPGVRGEIVVSGATDTWSYGTGWSGEESAAVWSGGRGSLELTPMAARQGPFTCTFCSGPADGDGTTFTVTSQADAPANWVMVDAGRDGTVEQTPDGWRSTVEGATVETAKAGLSTTAIVTLPPRVRSARLELRHAAPQQTESVVTLRRAGNADIQVRNARSSAPLGAARVTRPLLSVGAGSTTVSAVGADTVVSIAGDTNLASVTVRRDHELVVSQVDGTTVDVAYKGGDVDSRTAIDLRPAAATVTDLAVTKGELTARPTGATARRVSAARRTRSAPLPVPTATSRPVPVTYPTIDVTLPD